MEEQFVSLASVANDIGVSDTAIRKLISADLLPAKRDGRFWKVQPNRTYETLIEHRGRRGFPEIRPPGARSQKIQQAGDVIFALLVELGWQSPAAALDGAPILKQTEPPAAALDGAPIL